MIELRTLGPLDLIGTDGQPVDAVLKQPKRVAVFVYMALESRKGHILRESMPGVFWPEKAGEKGRASLRQALHLLRNDLGEDVLSNKGDERVAVNWSRVQCDAHMFEEAIERDDLRAAVSLYRGDFLKGFYLRGNIDFDRWLEGKHHRFERTYLTALGELAARAAKKGDHNEAAEWYRLMVENDPYRTQVALNYMESMAVAGDRVGALRHADRYIRSVRDDLGATPSSEVLEYAERLRKQGMRFRRRRYHSNPPVDAQSHWKQIQSALGERYKLEYQLDSGGMSTVYLAEDLRLSRKIAVKVLRPELAAAVGADRFLQEIEVTAKLIHPCIVPLYDFGDVDGLLYYIMPYYKGQSLWVRLNREKRLPIDDAIQITQDVAGALQYAHEQGIIHRDIKPPNILLGPGHALVSDFGIARALTVAGGEKLTETGQIVGTPGYMSPEQATGERDLDGRTDQYSLACTLFEMLTGALPFDGEGESILSQQLSKPPPSVAKIRDDVPGSVDTAIVRALTSVPVDRFSNVADFAYALNT